MLTKQRNRRVRRAKSRRGLVVFNAQNRSDTAIEDQLSYLERKLEKIGIYFKRGKDKDRNYRAELIELCKTYPQFVPVCGS